MTETSLGGSNVHFQPTLWTTVLRARDSGGEEARAALGRLVERYWKPLYFFARRNGCDVEAAKDATQSFFERVVEHEDLRRVAPEKGRFRNWLLAAMSHHLSNARDHAQAVKRGGAADRLDFTLAERQLEGASGPADQVFARAWALEVLARSTARLRAEWGEADRTRAFEVLQRHLSGATASYGEIAAQLGMAEHDVKNLLHRMKTRLREILREEVAESVEDPKDVDVELTDLFSALSR